MNEPAPAYSVALACRRDALLLFLGAWAILAWAWAQGPLLAGFASIIAGFIFAMITALLRQSTIHSPTEHTLPVWWARSLIAISTLPATLLMGWAVWQGLASWLLMGVLGGLAFAWQLWLYFWMMEPPDTKDEG